MGRTGIRIITAIAVVAGVLSLTAAPTQAAPGPRPRTVVVPRDYPTIQGAIDAVPAGSTVAVQRGSYTEELVINKDLTLLGDATRSIVRSPASLTPFAVHLPDGRGLTAIVRVGGGAHVRMSGLTVTGPIPCGVEVTGVQVLEGATLSLTGSHITQIQADPTSCTPQEAAGRAVVYGLPAHIVLHGQVGSPAYGVVAGVWIDHYQHAGISIAGPASGAISRVSVVGNVILGGWTIPSFQYGVDVEDGASAAIVGNGIIGNVCGGPPCGPDPINQAQGDGVVVLGVRGPVGISGNSLAGNDVGIYQVVAPGCCEISRNRLDQNRYFGIVIQDGDGHTDHNVVLGGRIGIGIVADFVDTTAVLEGDQITGTSVATVSQIDCCGAKATAIVRPGHP